MMTMLNEGEVAFHSVAINIYPCHAVKISTEDYKTAQYMLNKC